MNLPEKVKRKLESLPDGPGCYMMRDRSGRIIYVGKAVSLARRVKSYFRDAALRSASPKLRGLVRSIEDLDFIPLKTEAEAILLEGRLIKDYRPRYNTSFKDDKRFLLIKADLRRPFPVFQTARLRREDGAAYFGPYPSSRATRTTLEFVEREFGLRRCAATIPGPEDHRHCIDDIVRFCSAPCIGGISPAAYQERVVRACAALRGEDSQLNARVETAMRDAAARRDYERAAVLRDVLRSLRFAVRRAVLRGRTPAQSRADAAAGLSILGHALGLPAPPRLIECFDVSCISGTHAVASMVCANDGAPCPGRYRRFRIRTASGQDDPGMMAEAVGRRYRRLLEEQRPLPDLVMVDGGITQLRAARRKLAELGLAAMPVVGLAKRYEELFKDDPAVPDPIRLPDDSPALRLVQRIRDEAHRFALDYHRRLRSARIRESVLDDVPGIGPDRKVKLLRVFGSVRSLAGAAEAEIAAVPGIGPALAKRIAAALGGANRFGATALDSAENNTAARPSP